MFVLNIGTRAAYTTDHINEMSTSYRQPISWKER